MSGVLEAAVYVDDLEATERFYGGILGLPIILTVPGRQLVFRCQESILLVFNPQQTERERIGVNGGAIPLHAAHGAGLMVFRMAKQDLEAWRQYFDHKGMAIESAVSWRSAARSIYFRNPAGNSLALATPALWQGSMTQIRTP